MRNPLATRVSLPIGILATITGVSLGAPIPLIEQGRAALGRGDADAAITALEKAIVQYPKSADAQYYLATAYSTKGQSLGMLGGAQYGSKAMDGFQKAVALDPRHVEARYSLVQFYSMAPGIMGGSFDKALEQAKAIKAVDPIVGHRAYAVVYSQQKQPDLAKKEYLDAIREQPGSPKAHGYFGRYLANTEKNYGAAFGEFEAALKLDPGYMPAFYQLGRTASMADSNLARGEASLKKYLEYMPKEDEPPLARAHYFLGAVYEKEGRKAAAKQSYEAALKLNPTMKDASEALKRVSS